MLLYKQLGCIYKVPVLTTANLQSSQLHNLIQSKTRGPVGLPLNLCSNCSV